jgi:hypothetical protein
MINYCIEKMLRTLRFIKELAIEIGKYNLETGVKWEEYF